MKTFARLVLCAAAFVALSTVHAVEEDVIPRAGCFGGDDETPAPTPSVAPAPTAVAPAPTTVAPAPTTVAPAPTTVAPSPTTVAPAPTTVAPAPTTVAPAPTTVAPVPTTVAPTPSPTTVAPTPSPTPASYDENTPYDNYGRDCDGFIKSSRSDLSDADCLQPFTFYFQKTKYNACFKCPSNFVYDLKIVPYVMCNNKPMCGRFSEFTDVTPKEIKCVVEDNGKSPEITDACGLADNI
ncbi:hypothetical protein FI667_g4647, partial [Globisporangium splendens]